MFGQKPEPLFSNLRIQMLHIVDKLNHSVDIEARLDAHRVPQNRRRVEHERLEEENKRHPLVVRYVGFFEVVGPGHSFLPRQIIRIRYPAYVIGVFDV